MQQLCAKFKDAKAQQANGTKADPWVSRKLAVGLCYGLLIYCYYVYVGRVCAPMIRQDDEARGSKAEGIVLLVFFNILWLLLVYTYTLICITPPGFAKDYVDKSPCPEPPFPMQQVPPLQPIQPSFQIIRRHEDASRPATGSSTSTAIFAPDDILPPSQTFRTATGPTMAQRASETQQQDIANEHSQKAAFGPGIAQGLKNILPGREQRNSSETTAVGRGASGESARSKQQTGRPSMAASARSYLNFDGPIQGNLHDSAPKNVVPDNAQSGKANLRREVPLSAPLHPYLRYCNKDELVKPPRTHHCRHCGTCVLNMDHHCPWIGQCCGAHNHIYFVTFCFWACISLGYVFITLLVSLVPPNVAVRPSLDPQITVICAISAVLSFFTGSMAVTHWGLIMLNQSTIESMAIADMKHYEHTRINKEYGMLHLKQKRKVVKGFDQEWGKLNTEGNLWWLGSKKTNWTAVMGSKALAWFIPPPNYRPENGLQYQPNPRRGPDGKWIRRSEWPADLQ